MFQSSKAGSYPFCEYKKRLKDQLCDSKLARYPQMV